VILGTGGWALPGAGQGFDQEAGDTTRRKAARLRLPG
jgi:hypothetical protein